MPPRTQSKSSTGSHALLDRFYIATRIGDQAYVHPINASRQGRRPLHLGDVGDALLVVLLAHPTPTTPRLCWNLILVARDARRAQRIKQKRVLVPWFLGSWVLRSLVPWVLDLVSFFGAVVPWCLGP